jgi:hypothetical protein
MKYLTGCLLALLANAAYPLNEYATDPVQIDEVAVGFKDKHFIFSVKNGSVQPPLVCGISGMANKQIMATPDKVDVETLLPIILAAQASAAFIKLTLEFSPCTSSAPGMLLVTSVTLLPKEVSLTAPNLMIKKTN